VEWGRETLHPWIGWLTALDLRRPHMAIGIYSLQAELISAMASSASIDIRHKE